MSTSLFGSATPTQNPFAVASSKTDTQLSLFNFTQAPSAFGAPSGPNSNVFGSKLNSFGSTVRPNVAKSNTDNGQVSFMNKSTEANNKTASGSTELPNSNISPPQTFNGFTKPSQFNQPNKSAVSGIFGPSKLLKSEQNLIDKFNNFISKPNLEAVNESASRTNPSDTIERLPLTFAEKIQAQLTKDKIFAPSLSTLEYDMDPTEFIKSATELRIEFLKYREKVRVSLIKANLLDDPNVPKKLEDAIDFKGTCDEMCPEYECLTRMVDRRYDKSERDINPDGSLSAQPNPVKMVKALARSAAGQDAPLPGDIRTAAALRRTVDHLFNTVLAERELETVHGFLWDRTRAVRRDFVFHSSMTPAELVDQVYCLEHIIRFHVISLHYMSKEGIPTDGFSDQQEREQLSKSLLSLIHAYEDCKLQGVNCENEVEFKAYYILFNGEIPGIMEAVQNWGWEVWENSEVIRIAVSLSESLQNSWDFHGPLNPISTTEISQNAYSRFFCIVEDPGVSYTMACFAEIYFNKIRKAILRTILSSYRKQRGKTKDWTLENLNTYLRFDSEDEVEPFVELYGLQFSEIEGEWCLSFDSANSIQDPHPLPKQPHSYYLVEKKRGKHTISEAINRSVYELGVSIPMSVEPLDLASPNNCGNTQNKSKTYSEPGTDSQNNLYSKITSSLESGDKTMKLDPIGTQNSVFSGFARPGTVSESPFTNLGVNASKILKFPSMNSVKSTKEFPEQNTLFPPSKTFSSQIEPPENLAHPGFSFNDSTKYRATKQYLLQHEKKPDSEIINSSLFITEVGKPIGCQSTTPKSNPFQPLKAGLDGPQIALSEFEEKYPSLSLKKPLSEQTKPATQQLLSPSKTSAMTTHNSAISIKTFPSIFTDTVSNINLSTNELVRKEAGKKRSRLEQLTEWIVNGDEGLLEQFSEIHATKLVHEVFISFKMNQLKKAQDEADKVDRDRADHFRKYSLSVKYGYTWREQARRLRLKRRGREARQARREMAQNMKIEKTVQSSNLVEDFRASTTLRRRQRESSGNLEISPGNPIKEPDFCIDAPAYNQAGQLAHKRRRSEKSTISEISSLSNDQAIVSMTPLNRSLLSDPSYLSGESRIHFLSNHLKRNENRKYFNGVHTDYFRLKARGIAPFVDGIFFPNKNQKHASHQTQDQEKHINSSRLITKSTEDPESASSLSNASRRIEAYSFIDKFENECLKEKKDELPLYEIQTNKRQLTDDDISLFDRAKKIRDQMDEGADWFRKEVEKSINEI